MDKNVWPSFPQLLFADLGGSFNWDIAISDYGGGR
jgi:hypothetical protein